LLTEHYDELELLAQTLLEKETLDEHEIKTLIKTGKLPEQDADKKEVKLQIHGKPDMETKPETPDASQDKPANPSDKETPEDDGR